MDTYFRKLILTRKHSSRMRTAARWPWGCVFCTRGGVLYTDCVYLLSRWCASGSEGVPLSLGCASGSGGGEGGGVRGGIPPPGSRGRRPPFHHTPPSPQPPLPQPPFIKTSLHHTSFHHIPPSSHPPWTEWLRDRCKNITLSQVVYSGSFDVFLNRVWNILIWFV